MADLHNYGSCFDFDGRLEDVIYNGVTGNCRFFQKAETDWLFFCNEDYLFYVDKVFLNKFCQNTRMRIDNAKSVLEAIGKNISAAGVSYEVAMQLLSEVQHLRRHGTSDNIPCGIYRSQKLRIKITPTKEEYEDYFYNHNIDIVFVKDGRLLVI